MQNTEPNDYPIDYKHIDYQTEAHEYATAISPDQMKPSKLDHTYKSYDSL